MVYMYYRLSIEKEPDDKCVKHSSFVNLLGSNFHSLRAPVKLNDDQ